MQTSYNQVTPSQIDIWTTYEVTISLVYMVYMTTLSQDNYAVINKLLALRLS